VEPCTRQRTRARTTTGRTSPPVAGRRTRPAASSRRCSSPRRTTAQLRDWYARARTRARGLRR
jgi:hypothetical protein